MQTAPETNARPARTYRANKVAPRTHANAGAYGPHLRKPRALTDKAVATSVGGMRRRPWIRGGCLAARDGGPHQHQRADARYAARQDVGAVA